MILLGSERPNINVRQYSRLKDRSQGTREGGDKRVLRRPLPMNFRADDGKDHKAPGTTSLTVARRVSFQTLPTRRALASLRESLVSQNRGSVSPSFQRCTSRFPIALKQSEYTVLIAGSDQCDHPFLRALGTFCRSPPNIAASGERLLDHVLL
jgi:hypothetical protein